MTMMTMTTIKKSHRIIRLGDALSQFLNVLIFNGDPNYSISGESYRRGLTTRKAVIDFIFSPIESEHCKKAYEHDVLKARILLAKHQAEHSLLSSNE
jgi:hypothetical protein